FARKTSGTGRSRFHTARRTTPAVGAILDMRLSKAAGSQWVFPAPTKSGHMEPSTLKKQPWIVYEYFVRLHLAPKLGHVRLVKLQVQVVRDFLSERLDSGLSARTVKHLRAASTASSNCSAVRLACDGFAFMI